MKVRSHGTKPSAFVNPSRNESRKITPYPATLRQLRNVDVEGPLPFQDVYGRSERLSRMLYIGRIVRRRDVELDIAFEDPTLA